jgi:hypothetical protein
MKDFNQILDECIDRINQGENLESCLKSYPGIAKELEPLLRAMTGLQSTYSFTPSDDAKRAARQRFLTLWKNGGSRHCGRGFSPSVRFGQLWRLYW